MHECKQGALEKTCSPFGLRANETAILKESKFPNVVAEHNR